MQVHVLDGMKVGIAQMSVLPGHSRVNANWKINAIDQAEADGLHMLIFPEMSTTGYVIGDMFEREGFIRDAFVQNQRVIDSTKGKKVVVIDGTILIDEPDKTGEDGRLRKINGAVVIQDGACVVGQSGLPFAAKTNLPKYRMFDEVRHMTTLHELAAERGYRAEDLLKPFEITIGEKVLRIGLITCEDGWIKDYRVKPPLVLAMQGIDLLVNVSASPWGWQKNRARHEAFCAYIAEIGVPMIYANISGTQNNGKGIYNFDGASTVYNKHGQVAAMVEPYFSGVQHVTLAEDMPMIEVVEKDDRAELFDGVYGGFKGLMEQTVPPHLRKFSIALSGGIDSAVVFALEALAVGTENVYPTNMPFGDHNSPKTMASAQHTVHMLGNPHFQTHRIDEHVRPKMVWYGMDEEHPGLETVIAMERKNLELGRARFLGGIALCTGNKTEIGYGFFCNDGDGRGAFAPLGDLLKGEVRQLAYHMNVEVFQKEVIPWALIDGGIPAAAELGSSKGGMSADPFDYGYVTRDGEFIRGYHDQMLHAFVGFRKEPEWFLERYMAGDLDSELLLQPGKVTSLFASPQEFVADVERCWRLEHRSVWKRVQAPTHIAVSKRPYGFDNRQSLMEEYYTDRYYDLKAELLAA